ncbi:MAG: hypothetical protein OEY67_09780, partial [Gammaproteobacteria bacterium]|nr:hypothetical protein [Gammaproteobacteria bacterium]
MICKKLLWLMAALSLCVTVLADELKPMNPNADHVERWNWFVEAVYTLHQKQIAGREIRTTEKTGGFYREPEFYKEVQYIDVASNRRISTIRWERKNPKLIHWIETLIYDEQGRVIRDYGAAFLTHSRNAPQQTLINLHAYNGALHAYRQFDATDNRIYEFCEGTFNGQKINLVYYDIDILQNDGVVGGAFDKPEYKACF